MHRSEDPRQIARGNPTTYPFASGLIIAVFILSETVPCDRSTAFFMSLGFRCASIRYAIFIIKIELIGPSKIEGSLSRREESNTPSTDYDSVALTLSYTGEFLVL